MCSPRKDKRCRRIIAGRGGGGGKSDNLGYSAVFSLISEIVARTEYQKRMGKQRTIAFIHDTILKKLTLIAIISSFYSSIAFFSFL